MSNRTFSAEQLREVIALFQVYGDIVAVNRYGSGHINDTFKVDISLGGVPVSYILQRINDGIFTRPDRVMENIARVTNHIRCKFAGADDASRRTLTVIPSRDGQPVVRGPEGGWWPYLKTKFLDISWLNVGNAIIDMDEVWTTLRNYLEEKVQGYRMCPGLMLYRTVQKWLMMKKARDERRADVPKECLGCLARLEKEMEDLVKLYPTETTKEAADRVYYDQMPQMMFMLPKANNERK